MSELGRVVTELQVKGLRDGSLKGNRGRRGGAGPSDHRALEFDGTTVMVPIYNDASSLSPYSLDACGDGVALNGLQQEHQEEKPATKKGQIINLTRNCNKCK